ncbi:MAG: 1-acyl-sn-glycerol-3-phosphate acyltransferase [Lachnospiraceae bacterium]
MRLILVSLFLIIYSFFTIPMCLVEWAVGKVNPQKKAVIAQRCVVAGFKIILFISGVKLTIKGEENILHDRAALYTYNHRGFFDILVGYTTAPMRTAYVSKKEIENVPMISWWMKCMNCLFLDREDIKQGMKTILDGIELMKNGTSIYIAPEGTRNTGDGVLEFHDASFKLADKSKSPIVPVAINNTDEVFEKHLPWIHSQHVIIEYCTPIYMESMDKKEKKRVGETVRQIISEKIKQNAQEI